MFLVVGITVLLIIITFAFPQFSPVPYFPTNKKDLPKILELLQLKNGQVLIDLGAGDGILVFEAAKMAFHKNLTTKFVAVELNPFLVLILHLRRIFHANRRNIRIIWGDMFKINLKEVNIKNLISSVIYLYISPWYLEKVYKKLRKELGSFTLISYFYAIPHFKPTKKIEGVHPIFIYNIKND